MMCPAALAMLVSGLRRLCHLAVAVLSGNEPKD
jgi:hypothetical protein